MYPEEKKKVSMTTKPKTNPKAVGNWIVMKPLKPSKAALTPHCLSAHCLLCEVRQPERSCHLQRVNPIGSTLTLIPPIAIQKSSFDMEKALHLASPCSFVKVFALERNSPHVRITSRVINAAKFKWNEWRFLKGTESQSTVFWSRGTIQNNQFPHCCEEEWAGLISSNTRVSRCFRFTDKKEEKKKQKRCAFFCLSQT